MKRAPKGNSKEGKRKGKWRRLPSRRVDELDVVAAMDPVFEGAEQPLTLSDLWDRTFSQLETEGLVTINSLQYEPITPQQLLEYESKEPILLVPLTPWTKEQFPENDLKKPSRFLDKCRSLGIEFVTWTKEQLLEDDIKKVFLSVIPYLLGEGYLIATEAGFQHAKQKGPLKTAYTRSPLGTPYATFTMVSADAHNSEPDAHDLGSESEDFDFDPFGDEERVKEMTKRLDPVPPPDTPHFPRQFVEEFIHQLQWAAWNSSKEHAAEEIISIVSWWKRKPQGPKAELGQSEYELFMHQHWSWREIAFDAGFDGDEENCREKVRMRAIRYAIRSKLPLPNTRPRFQRKSRT